MPSSQFCTALALALTGTLMGCNKNVDQDRPMAVTGQDSARSAASQPEAAEPQAAASGGGTVEGTVRIAPHLASLVTGREVLFLIARKAAGGPPLAVKKLTAPVFPQRFRLTGSDVMMEGFELSGDVTLTARLDQDGAAGPVTPGDLIGAAVTAAVGGPAIELLIDQAGGGTAAGAPGAPAAPPMAEPPAAQRIELPAAPPGDTMAARPPTLEGTILLDPALASQGVGHPALYIIVRPEDGGPPLAVKRVAAPSFPYRFRLGPEDMMLEGRDLAGKITISVRLDKDGAAGAPATGDLLGSTPGPVLAGGDAFVIVIREPAP